MAPAASPFGIIGKFFGNTVSEAAAFAAGVAIGPVLGPPTQALRNKVNAAYPFVPPPYAQLAAGVAQGQVDEGAARAWAKEQGIGDDAFSALRAIADTGPGVARAFELWRRGQIDDAGFRRACKRAALEDEWVNALVAVKRVLLSPAELANAVVQGFRSEAEAAVDAELQGYTAADFQTMVDVTGLPPGPETLQAWVRRGIITEAELEQGIREGHTKIKYIDPYKASLPQLLSAAEWAGLRLRGWVTAEESYAGGAQTGYDRDAMEKLFLNRGRPATPRQIRIGYARGARIEGFAGDVVAAIKRATKQSDIRPEYEDIEVEASWTYPSAFVLRALASDGTFTEAQTRQILIESGWKPEYAQLAAAKWAKGTGAAGKAETKAELQDEYAGGYLSETELRDALTKLGYTGAELELEVHLSDAKRVKRWREKAIDAIGKAFIAHDLTEQAALDLLGQAGVTGEAAALLLPWWKLDALVHRKHLTAAQVKRAFTKGILSRDQAIADLVLLDYTAEDAAVYLDE